MICGIEQSILQHICGVVTDQYFTFDLLSASLQGIIAASIIALGAIGVSLLFGVLRFANFAHGDLMTLGAYGGFLGLKLPQFIAGLGIGGTLITAETVWPVWAALPFAMLMALGAAMLVDQLIYRPLRKSQPIILLIVSFGAALALRSLIQIAAGPDNRSLQDGLRQPIELWNITFMDPKDGFSWQESLTLLPDQIGIMALSLLFMIGLGLFLKYSRTGRAMRAVSDNPDLARVTGINTERIILWCWLIGGAMAGAAGLMLALETRLHPQIGWNLLLPIFAAAILGGIGRPAGAVLGALVVGLAQEISTLFIPASYKPAIAFLILVLVLILRPQGILRGK